jgi:hypothetical protein
MSCFQQFICYPCGQSWQDKYTFWNGYRSPCPLCGKLCEAFCDTQVFADQKEIDSLYDAPLFGFDSEGPEKTEADLEAERDLIHDEIAEALGAVEADTSDIHDGSAEAEADTDEAGGGF